MTTDKDKNPLMQDLSRGFSGLCPNCGKGKMFRSFLKTEENCAVCGEEFHHHRADDFPAYVVIVIVGHVMVTLALWLEEAFAPPLWVHMVVTLPMTLAMTLGLLQPVKGAIVALQWRMHMHGFKLSRADKK